MKRPRLLNSQSTLLEAVVFDGYDFGILMPYIEGANKIMLARSGFFIRRGEHPLCRYWRVPKAKLLDELDLVFRQLYDLADGKVTESWQGFRQKIEVALTTPRRDAFIWGMSLRIAPLDDGGVLLSGDYHPGVVAVARRMHGVYLGRSSSWRINATAEILRSNLILELGLAEEQFEILDVVQELLGDGSVVPAEDIPRISLGGAPQESPATASGEETSNDIYLAAVSPIERTEFSDAVIAQALDGYSLLEHQPAGIAHLLQRTSALLADDMGLGKTRQSIIAAHICAAGRPILVVTLSSLLINWQREVQAVYPDAKIALQKHDPQAQWMLINYERLGDYVTLAEHYHVLVVDEAHQLKEPTAERTRHGFDIAAKVPNRYLLTGTPVLNRETELHTLLRLSGHPVGQLPLGDFCERFAGNPEFRQNLRAELGDWMLRRRKDVLPGLKGKQRQLLPVAMAPEERRKYDTIRLEDKPIFARLGALRREDWILDQVDRGVDVLLTNPELVKTGLDLLDFPTIAFLQTGYNVYTLQQAARRSWRIGQKHPVRVVFFGYAGSSQITCLQLMAKKIAVAQSTSGDVPESGLDSLNQDGDSVEMALARQLIAA